MKKIVNMYLLALTTVIIIGSGCSGLIISRPAVGEPPNGIRVYPPKVYLFVNDQAAGTIVYLPDYSESYDVKPMAFLMKQEFTLKLTGGQVTEITDNQDPTPFFQFLSGVAQKAIEAAIPKPVAGESVQITLPPGVYVLDKGTGQFVPASSFNPPATTQVNPPATTQERTKAQQQKEK